MAVLKKYESFLNGLDIEIVHKGISSCARIEIRKDADNADQKVKWFLKVHKTYKHLWEAYLQFPCSQVFIQVHILQNFRFSSPSK